MEPLVQVQRLTKRFDQFTALDEVTLEVQPGEVFGLLGPNGAGKSTLIRTLMGFLRPTSGWARIDQLDCHRQPEAVHRRVSYLPGDARLYRLMRARRALQLFCQMRPESSLERAAAIAQRLELDLNGWVGLMSTGMRQKLALSIVLAADVPLLILDEPTANLDPTVRGEILRMVTEAREAGRTVILSSHVLSEIEETCDRVGILRSGRLVFQRAMTDITRQQRIRARLLAPLPDLPPALEGQLEISQQGDQVLIQTPGELSVVLRWLAAAELADVYVEPVGLRAVYDQYHPPQGQLAAQELAG